MLVGYMVTLRTKGKDPIRINDIDNPNGNNRITDTSLTFSWGALASFQFSIYPNNDGYDRIHPEITNINVSSIWRVAGGVANRTEFDGYIVKTIQYMDERGLFYKQVACEEATGYLYNSVQTYAHGNATFSDYVKMLLAKHNTQVDKYAQFSGDLISDIPGYNPDYVIPYGETYDSIKSTLDLYIGHFYTYPLFNENQEIIRHSLNYLREDTAVQTPSGTLRLTQNIKNFELFNNTEEICTVIWAYGYKLKAKGIDGKEYETGERLSLTSVNGGKEYIVTENADDLTAYGLVNRYVEYNDVTSANTLLTLAKDYLAKHSSVYQEYKINALDMEVLKTDSAGESRFQLGEYYNFVYPVVIDGSILENDTIKLRCTGLSLDINAPQSATISFATKYAVTSDIALINTKPAELIDFEIGTKTDNDTFGLNVSIPFNITVSVEDNSITDFSWYIDNTAIIEHTDEGSTASAISQQTEDNPTTHEPSGSLRIGTHTVKCVVTTTNYNALGAKTANLEVTRDFNVVNARDAEKPVINLQPTPTEDYVGFPLYLEVGANPVTTGNTLSYQWYMKTSSTGQAYAISGETSSSYYVSMIEEPQDYYYFCRVTCTNPNATGIKTKYTDSNTVRGYFMALPQSTLPPNITGYSPTNIGTYSATNTTGRISVGVIAAPVGLKSYLTYQWYVSKFNDYTAQDSWFDTDTTEHWQALDGETASTLDLGTAENVVPLIGETPNNSAQIWFKCVVTNNNDFAVGSKTYSAQHGDGEICAYIKITGL